MSRNIYKVIKKSDLDEIMKNNFFKPICILFLSKSKINNNIIYDDICIKLNNASQENNYVMIIIIDFDNFLDNINYFTPIKEKIPYFIIFFKGRLEISCENSDNFLPNIITHIQNINNQYKSVLEKTFDNNNIKNIKNDNNIHDKNIINNEINNDNDKNDIINNDDSNNDDSNNNSSIQESSYINSDNSSNHNKKNNKKDRNKLNKNDNDDVKKKLISEKLKKIKKLKEMLKN